MSRPESPTRTPWRRANTLVAALLLVTASCLGSPTQASAAEAAEAPADETPADAASETPVQDAASDTSTDAARPAGQAGSAAAGEVFIPTEEISEDFAVAFPVDI